MIRMWALHLMKDVNNHCKSWFMLDLKDIQQGFISVTSVHLWLKWAETEFFIVAMGFPDSSAGKESACNAGDPGSIPGLGRSTGEGKRYALQYCGLENSMDYIVHGVTKNWTQPSELHIVFPVVTYGCESWTIKKAERRRIDGFEM